MKNAIIICILALAGLTTSAQVYKGSYASTREEKLNEEYCSGLFESTHGDIIDVASSSSAVGYNNILNWLQGRVGGLQIYSNRNGVLIPVIRGGVPGIFVDEMQVSAAYLDLMNMNDIAIVKIIRTPFYGGFNSGYGAIAIYTKGGEDEEEEDSK